jgi:hypothetical protein
MCQALYLQNLEGSIQDREWRDHLAGKTAGYVSMSVADGASTRGVEDDTSAAAEAAHTRKKLKAQRELHRAMAKQKLNGIERTAVLATPKEMVAGINDGWDAPDAGVEAAPKDLDSWWDRRQNGQQFVGLGYGTLISRFVASRTSFKSDIPKMTHAERRMLRREIGCKRAKGYCSQSTLKLQNTLRLGPKRHWMPWLVLVLLLFRSRTYLMVRCCQSLILELRSL